MGPPPQPLPVTEEDAPPTTPASYRVPPRARHLPTAFVRSGPREDWVSKRGSYHPMTATSVRGSHGQTTRRVPPKAADGWKTSRGGTVQARDARSRTDWIVSRTTSKRLEPRTALRRTTGLHSELTEPYGLAVKMDDGVPWHKGVSQGAENFMTSWHKEEEDASRRCATKRDGESSTTENTTRLGGVGIPRGTSVGEWYKLRTQLRRRRAGGRWQNV